MQGIFSYELTAFSTNVNDRNSTKQAPNKIEVLPKPFNILFFRINNINSSDKPNLELNEGDTITLSWKVEGENISVKLYPYGDVQLEGTQQLSVIRDFPTRIALQVNSTSSNQPPQERGFVITVRPLPTPTVAPVPINTYVPASFKWYLK